MSEREREREIERERQIEIRKTDIHEIQILREGEAQRRRNRETQ